MILAKELKVYNQALEKILSNYSDYQIDGEMFDNGLPAVDNAHKDAYFNDVNELLHIKIKIDLYKVDLSVFDYNESDRYDSLSPIEIIELQEILC